MNLIGVEGRKKLKGQGTVSDSEAEAFAKSATLFSNPLSSEEAARRELKRVSGVFEDTVSRNAPLIAESGLPDDVTNDDISETMRAMNMTRQQVIDKLRGQ